MPIAIKRYSDGSYTPLSKPWSRRVDIGTPPTKKKTPGPVRRMVSKMLDNAANGIIRGTGSKPRY